MLPKLDKALVLLVGLCFGSFGGMLASRLPEGKPFTGRSHCLSCGRVLGFRELVPVLGYVAQKGRCKECGNKISPAYLLVEFCTAGSFLLFYNHFGLGVSGLLHLIIAFHLCVLIGTDMMHGLLPNKILLSTGSFALILRLLPKTWTNLKDGLFGAAVGFGLFYAIAFIKPGAMGGGDVKMAGVIGLYLGFPKTLPALGLAFVLSSAYCVPLLILGKLKRTDTMPLGIFLSIATVIMSVFDWPF